MNPKALVPVILFSFIALMFCGLASPVSIDGTDMPGCHLINSDEAICSMGFLEHLVAWQRFFTINAPLIFNVLFLGLTFAYIVSKLQNDIPRVRAARAYSRKLVLPDSLEEAFARGILHSKAY